MIIIIAEPGKKVHLGRIGENEARAVQFDISKTQAEFPGASFSVLNMRPQDPDAYPVNGQFIRIEGSNLYWTLQSGDLTEDGLGECELKATVDGVIVKSEIWTTEICPALDGNGTPPEPWESWVEQVEDDADRAEESAEDSEAWANGERGGEPVEDDDPAYHNNAKYWAEQAEETLASKADKRDTVLETTLSRGRKANTPVGVGSFAFGNDVEASGQLAFGTGDGVIASGIGSFAEGISNTSSGYGAHSEGYMTTSSGEYGSHAEGVSNVASKQAAHAEGQNNTASGMASHVDGMNNTANHKAQHVFGEYNVPDPSTQAANKKGNYVEIVGNGTSAGAKSNARTLDWNGNERLKGDLYVGANADGTGGTKVAKVTDIPEPVDISGKADKVSGGTADNFAGLDAEGNLKDSGKAASDFVAAEDFRADAMPMSATDPKTVAQTATELKSQIQQKAPIIFDTVTNVPIASVSDATAHPVRSLIIGIDPVQDTSSGDPSPSHFCPITGWDAVKVTGTGINLFDKTISCTEWKIRGDDGTETSSSNSKYTDPIGGFEPNTQYTIQGTLTGSSTQFRIYYLDKNKGWISRTSGISGNSLPYTFTTPANCRYIEVQCHNTSSDFNTVMIEKGETASAYTAYTGQTHTADLPSTVFGGQLRWTDGKADSAYGIATYTGSNDEDWVYGTHPTSGQGRVTCRIPNDALLETNDLYGNIIKANDTVKQYPSDWCAVILSASKIAIGVPSTITSADAFKALLNTTNLVVCYRLATPIEIPLSVDEISTVEGINNIFADCGDILLCEYGCDTKAYVEKRITASQNLMELIVTANRESELKASKAYSTGNLIIVNGTLYRATASIANGATLTVGTNVTQTTVAAELAALA